MAAWRFSLHNIVMEYNIYGGNDTMHIFDHPRLKYVALLPLVFLLFNIAFFRYATQEIQSLMLQQKLTEVTGAANMLAADADLPYSATTKIPVWISAGQWISTAVTFGLQIWLVAMLADLGVIRDCRKDKTCRKEGGVHVCS
jgi:hypothetical protein